METVRTICCKLNSTLEQRVEIDSTLTAFAAACNAVAEVCRTIDSTNRVKVHHACYRDIRERFGLSANHAVRAIARVCMALKVPEKRDSTFAPTSVDLDARTFRFHEADWSIGVTLLSGRVRLATILGDFQREALKGLKPTAATLVRRRDGAYYLHVQLCNEAPAPLPISDVLGVDLGIVHLVTDSDGETFTGAKVDEVRRRYHRRRKQLNQCGTKSARRRLCKIRTRESNFRRNENHIIANRLVAKAKRTGRGISLEDLRGIRGRVTARKAHRSRLHGWAFHQVKAFVCSKAQRCGIPVFFVDPRDTSRTCAECGHCDKWNRRSQSEFCCRHCGHSANADWNAARNIRIRANVNWPIVGVDDAGPRNPAETAYKPTASVVGS